VPSRVLGWLHRAEDLTIALLVSALLLLSVTQIGLRLFLHTGLEWAEPVSRVGVLWLAMLGALGAARAHRHIAIDALPKILPTLGRRIAWTISQLATAGICGALGWYSVGMVQMEREAPAAFVPGVPSWWPMLIMPAGFALMALRFAVSALGKPPEPGAIELGETGPDAP
jgi:TRAP-type C4-dicarboxylate transport system permease small subunit